MRDIVNKLKKPVALKRKKKIKPITKDMNLGDVIFKYPQLAEIFTDYGLHCIGCFAIGFDTIEMGCKVHGLDDEAIEEMMLRVNEVLSHGE
jgi:hybrid cluster-associated redox disulfide protein